MARLRAAVASFATDAQASAWLIDRLASDERGAPLSALAQHDEAALLDAILRMHETIYGVPLFAPPSAPARCPGDRASPLEFMRRYLASDEHFSGAIIEASRIGQ